jgi:WD40 repeat protein
MVRILSLLTLSGFNDTLLINFCKSLQNLGEESVGELLMGRSLWKSNFFRFVSDSGRAISFKPDDDSTFLVGTDEGMVYLCTTQYSSRYLNTYPAHNTPVYNIQWNTFIPNIFITCASEWIVKIWDRDSTKPLFMFDLNSQVGDVAWAPYSSTVFAAVTIDGKVMRDM